MERRKVPARTVKRRSIFRGGSAMRMGVTMTPAMALLRRKTLAVSSDGWDEDASADMASSFPLFSPQTLLAG